MTATAKVPARRLVIGCRIRLEGADHAPSGTQNPTSYWVEGSILTLARTAKWVELTALCWDRDGYSDQRHFVFRASALVAASHG